MDPATWLQALLLNAVHALYCRQMIINAHALPRPHLARLLELGVDLGHHAQRRHKRQA